MDAASAFAVEPRIPARQTSRASAPSEARGFEALVPRNIDDESAPKAVQSELDSEPVEDATHDDANKAGADKEARSPSAPHIDLTVLQAAPTASKEAMPLLADFALTLTTVNTAFAGSASEPTAPNLTEPNLTAPIAAAPDAAQMPAAAPAAAQTPAAAPAAAQTPAAAPAAAQTPAVAPAAAQTPAVAPAAAQTPGNLAAAESTPATATTASAPAVADGAMLAASTPVDESLPMAQPAVASAREPQDLLTQAASADVTQRTAVAAPLQQRPANHPAQAAAALASTQAAEPTAIIETPQNTPATPAPPSAVSAAALANAQPSQTQPVKTAPLSDAKGKASKSASENDPGTDGPKPANVSGKSQSVAAQMRPALANEIAPPPIQAVASEAASLPAGADSLGHAGAQTSSATPTAVPANAAPTALRGHTAAHLAAQITRRFDAGQTSFEVRLDPAELGRVDVRIDMTRDRGVHATISADSAVTLAELSRASKDLERALADAGLELAEGGLSFSLNDPGQQDSTGGRDASARTSYGQAVSRTAEAEDMPIGAKPLMISRWAGAGLDLWA